jgi:GTP cyclohydrolase I
MMLTLKAGQTVTKGLTEKQKLKIIEKGSKIFGKYLTALGFDWKNDPNMCDTPHRVTKAFVYDIFEGTYSDEPPITTFPNVDKYDGMVFQGNIELTSCCSHHFLSFIGKAHVAYLPSKDGKVIGLSKLNRIVEYFARRPQIQENLTMQIHDYISNKCEGNHGVAVLIESQHMCACVRGVRHDSIMKTSKLSGEFLNDPIVREEFYHFVNKLK